MEVLNSKDIIKARDLVHGVPRKTEPPIDKIVSELVGFKVYTTDPRLINLLVKWKKAKGNQDIPDNFLENPTFVKELREVFNQPL